MNQARKENKLNKKLLSRIILAVLVLSILIPLQTNAQITQALDILNYSAQVTGSNFTLVKAIEVGLAKQLSYGVAYNLSIIMVQVPVVIKSWEIMRGFSNMMFIIALIIMAFGTIFSVGGYDVRSLIARFIVAALLINFSLVICEIMIDWTQSLSNVFLNTIGNVGDQVAGSLYLGKNFQESLSALSQVEIADQTIWKTTVIEFTNVILLAIVVFSMAVLWIFTWIRIPILWALMIVSPIAWITYILPTTRNINKRWWNEFIGWNLFLPIYLFFIYFGLFFLRNQDTVIVDGASQDLFRYALVAVFLIGGAKVAMNAKVAAGAGGVAASIWAKGRATARFTRSLPGRGVGVAWRGFGAEKVYEEAREKFKKEGFAGFEKTQDTWLGRVYRGQRGREDMAARLGKATGLAPELAEKQLQKNIQFEEQKFKDKRMEVKELNDMVGSEAYSFEERVAAANRMKDLGQTIQGQDLAPLFDDFRKRSPVEAVRWIRGQNIENLSPEGLNALEKVDDPQLRQKVARIKAKRNLISDAEQYTRSLKLFEASNNGGEMASFIGDSKEFIDGLKKDEAVKIISAIPEGEEFKEAKRKFAMQIAEKGFLDAGQLEKLAGTSSANHGAFESSAAADKFLDLVKKTSLHDALEIKQKKGLLKDMYVKDKILEGQDGLQTALKQELGKAGGEDLTKLIKIEQTPDGKYAAKDQMVLQAFLQSLRENPRSATRIKSMYMDPKFTNHPIMGALDGPLKELQWESYDKDKGVPFKGKISEVTGDLIPKFEKALENDEAEEAKSHYKRAISNLEAADKLIKGIDKLDFVSSTRREELERMLSDARDRLEKAKKKKPKGPDNPDETPPKDDKGPKGPKGGGGGSSGGGSLPPGWSRPGGTTTWPRPQASPPAESESRVSGAVPFSTKAGTIPSGEIGRPPEEPKEPPSPASNVVDLRNTQSAKEGKSLKEIPELTLENIKTTLKEKGRIKVNAPKHYDKTSKELYPNSRALTEDWEVVDIDDSGLATLRRSTGARQTIPLEELRQYNSETNKEDTAKRINEGEEEDRNLGRQFNI